MSKALQDAARSIFLSALRAVDVRAAVQTRITRHGGTLTLAGRSVSLEEIDRVVVIAMGKAAVDMYLAAREALGATPHLAVVIAPHETLPPVQQQVAMPQAQFLKGVHPVPTSDSLRAADTVMDALSSVTSQTVVLFLISGGASAMVEKPLDATVTLQDLQTFTNALVCSGMSITAMNTVRKHFSAVKGGRLAVAAVAAAMQCTLLISDVPEASPDAIASGPSLPDSTTVNEARLLITALRQTTALPQNLLAWFDSPLLPETPNAENSAFHRSHWEVILSSDHLTRAASRAAEANGFHTLVDNTCDDWDYRDASHYLLEQGFAAACTTQRRTCLISVGEVGVTVSAHAGRGGRNQQFALLCAESLAKRGQTSAVLSAGSDGIDGHSDAAGAVCDETTLLRAATAGLSVRAALDKFDTTPLLQSLGDAIYTGPTGNNLRDLRLILIEP